MTVALTNCISCHSIRKYGSKETESPLPRIGVTYLLNPYDNSQFGDRVLGSFLPAFFICQDLQKEFPCCRLIGSNPSDAQDFGKLQIGQQLLLAKDLIGPEEKLSRHYDYTITVEPDPTSPLMSALQRVQTTNNASMIDLTKTPPVMRAILMKNGKLESQIRIEGNRFAASIESLTRKVPSEKSILIEIPYSTVSEVDWKNFVIAEGKFPILFSPVNLSDPTIRDQIKSLVSPTKFVPEIPFKAGFIPVVMNVRTGGNSDSSLTVKRYPAKFPPFEWYVQATKELKKKFPNQKMQIHIATDGDPAQVRQELEKRCQDTGIQDVEFTYLKKEALPENANLMEMDLWGAKKIKALICADSAFGALIGCNADADSLDYILTPKATAHPVPSRLLLPAAKREGNREKHIDLFANAKTTEIQGNQYRIDPKQTQITDFLAIRRYKKLQSALSYLWIKV